jgi:tetratricopeptide (TPR) repeat protein
MADDERVQDSSHHSARLVVCTACAWIAFASVPLHAQPVEEDPPSAASPATRADLGPASDLVRAGSYAAAEASLAELQQRFPDDPRLLFMRGELLLALGRAAEALPLLQRCAELDPTLARLHFQLGTALQATDDRAGALTAFAHEIERTDDARVKVLAHLNRSLLFERDANWSAAAAEIEAALAIEPTRLEAYGDLASVYLEADRPDDAARALEAGLAAGFRSAGHYYGLGSRYLKNREYEAASRAFRSALDAEPSHAESARNLAVALDGLGREAEALELYRLYLELRPEAADAGRIRERLGEAGD